MACAKGTMSWFSILMVPFYSNRMQSAVKIAQATFDQIARYNMIISIFDGNQWFESLLLNGF
jgi:hypothetical protein